MFQRERGGSIIMDNTVAKKGGGFGFWVCNFAFSLERFSFYSAKWVMTVFIAVAVAKGGLGLDAKDGAFASANLVAFTYLAPLFGSVISDRLVGAKYLVPIGMILMGCGYLVGWKATGMVSINLMIVLVSIGTGLFKPQTNAITGRLFADKSKLDAAFSTQYSMVNVGSFIGTTIIGVIANEQGYRFCFLVCAIIMFVNALWFIFGWRFLGDAGKRPFKFDDAEKKDAAKEKYENKPLTVIEKKRVWAIILISAFSTIFWLFWYLAYLPVYFHWDNPEHMNWMIGSFKIPSAWFDSLNALCCISMGPLLGILWTKDAKRKNGGLSMFKHTSIGMLLLGVSFVIFALTDVVRAGKPASIIWLIAFGILLSLGEMTFSPLGNSFISKFAPAKLLSAMMAVWTFSIFIAGKSYGYVYALTEKLPFAATYFGVAIIMIVAGVALWVMDGKLNKLVQKEED